MDTNLKLESIGPRYLRFRNHYKMYTLMLIFLSILIALSWLVSFYKNGSSYIFENYLFEFWASVTYVVISSLVYFYWLQFRVNRAVQVYEDCILIHKGNKKESLNFSEIESVNIVCWSLFYVKTKSGVKYYFSSSLERLDYVWEGLQKARPDLFEQSKFEEFRLKIVQYDHHQKRQEWFFKHKVIDVVSWVIVPILFMSLTFMVQSKDVVIYQQGQYFFRLFMFSMLVLVITTFIFSLVLKRFIFDKKFSLSIHNPEQKIRNMEFEGIILQRSKIAQLVSTGLVLGIFVQLDVNLFSVTKIRDDLADFNLKKGSTVIVDNRFNCISCKHSLHDGDIVLFGRGVIGQVLAVEGEMVGFIGSKDHTGRALASDDVKEVPQGHIALKASNGKDIVFVQVDELIGKIQK